MYFKCTLFMSEVQFDNASLHISKYMVVYFANKQS